jgi:lipopolysaccharide/colanic/teichoic acid biosynthesis glycosyltransferase
VAVVVDGLCALVAGLMALEVSFDWSLALDLQILWKTLSAVTRGSGAY